MSAGPSAATDAAAPAAGARSLADDIRSRSDEQLTALVLSRPDLARPAPSDLTSLAARAGKFSLSSRATHTAMESFRSRAHYRRFALTGSA